MKNLLLICLSLICLNVLAQDEIERFTREYWNYQGKDLDVANCYADSLLAFSRSIGDSASVADAFELKAIVKIQKADYDGAVSLLKRQRALNELTENELKDAIYNNRMATVQYYKSNIDSALVYWKKALIDYKKFDVTKKVVKTHNNIGVVYFERGEYEVAYKYYKGNQEYLESQKEETTALVNCYNNLGLVFKKLEDFEKSKEYYRKSLEVIERNGFDRYRQLVNLNLANIYKIEGEYRSAIENFEASLEIRRSNGMPIGVLLSSLGECYFHLSEYSLAEEFYLEAVVELEENGRKSAQSSNFSRMSELYTVQEQFGKAFDLRLKSVSIDRVDGDFEKMLDHYRSLRSLSYLLNDHELMKSYSDTLLDLKDSVHTKLLNGKIYEIESEYEVEIKEKEIAILKRDAELAEQGEWQMILMFLLGLALLIVVASGLYYRNTLLRKEKKIKDLELRNRGEKLQHSTLKVSKKNEDAENILKELKGIKENPTAADVRGVIKKLERGKIVDRNWDEYLSTFIELNPLFVESLKAQGVELTQAEIRLSALVLQGLTISQIAGVLNIGSRSVEVSRSRLRKKLNLNKGDKLREVLEDLAN